MDIQIEEIIPTKPQPILSYDETPYQEQLPTEAEQQANSLANRIGHTKVYLLSESTIKAVKRKHDDAEEAEEEEDEEMDADPTLRGNALLLTGTPISHLPTSGLFAYVTHFQAQPLALEWINDNTCIFVFKTKAAARHAYQVLQRHIDELPDEDSLVVAKPIPILCWPAEERIKSSLDQSHGLKGVLKIRWAMIDDVKKKGAKKESDFYKKHGSTAGKELYEGRTDLPPKRRRGDGHSDASEALERAKLDAELDEFLAESDQEPEAPPSPPSKMRSDYIASDGRTVYDTEPVIGIHAELSSRLTTPLPHRGGNDHRRNRLEDRIDASKRNDQNNRRERRYDHGGQRKNANPQPRHKTQQELDDELEAFLQGKD